MAEIFGELNFQYFLMGMILAGFYSGQCLAARMIPLFRRRLTQHPNGCR
ncbi:hypothetical protein ACTRXD_11275 [Nitrospira sp. T9]